ncbi:MAG: hypothetical protein HY870_14920 [Chloroflexi bacterium]|nr:hypothetical protein [Chloroflexota bacterium]
MTIIARTKHLGWWLAPGAVIAGFVLVVTRHLVNVIDIGNLDFFPLADRALQLSFASWDGWVASIHPVGYPWLLRLGLLSGFDVARWGQALSVLGGVLGLIGAYLIADAVTGSRLLACLVQVFVAATGYVLFFSSVEGNDMLAAGFQIISIGVLAYGLARDPIERAPRKRWIVLAAGLAGGGYLIRYTGLVTAGVSGLLLLGLAVAARRRDAWRNLALYALVFVAATALQWLPAWIVTGSPLINDQGKNVYFHVYGKSDFITEWNAIPEMSLTQVLALNPGKFIRHWWSNFQGFWFTSNLAIAESPLKLFGQAGLLYLLLLGKNVRGRVRSLLALFVLAHLAALSLMRLDPRFLLIIVPILVTGAVYFFRALLPDRWRRVPVFALVALAGLLLAAPIPLGFASDQPVTPSSFIEATDVLHAAGLITASEALSTDLRLHDLAAASRQRFAQANDLRALPHETWPQLLEAARAQGFQFLIYDRETGPQLYPTLTDLLSPETKPIGLTPIYIEPDHEFVIYRIEPASGSARATPARLSNGVALAKYELIISQPVTDTVSRDVGVFLHWTVERPQTTSYKVFVHLLDANGQLVAQEDSVPGLWFQPTTSWRPGDTVVDFHRLRVTGAAPGVYTVIAGLYDEGTGERATSVGPDGTPLDDKLALSTLELK